MSSSLFKSATLGNIEVSNCIAMAPMTRARCPNTNPDDSTARYYAQRAGAGLIISEATQISAQAIGSAFTPGIYTPEQLAGWKKTTAAVHAKGGKIVAQLWHTGRVSHESFHGGEKPVSCSAVRGECHTFTEAGYEATPEPRALSREEIPAIVADYRQAAINAIEAGFDGVQIHGANGYLIDQFLRDGVNQREDEYGGSIENRSRFLLEVVDAACDAIGAGRVGLRLSPFTNTYDCIDSDPAKLFLYLAEQLNSRKLAFLDIIERGLDPATVSNVEFDFGYTPADFRKVYQGQLMVNGQYDQKSAEAVISSGHAQMVGIGRPFMGTPDLVERFQSGQPLNEMLDVVYWYGGDDTGYIDQPALAD